MITYHTAPSGKITVKLDGKVIGHIVLQGGYYIYRPKNSTPKFFSEPFGKLADLKASIEGAEVAQ
jgi:hypothetical protein